MVSALERVAGVSSVRVNLRAGEAVVVRDGRRRNDQELAQAVTRAGYPARVVPTTVIDLRVEGLDCKGCGARASAAVSRVPGAKRVIVRPRQGGATVTYDTRRATPTRIAQAFRQAGFPARTVGATPVGRRAPARR